MRIDKQWAKGVLLIACVPFGILSANSADHELERDYTGSNPAGVWSYGWQGTLGGAFTRLAHHGTRGDGLDYWMVSASRVPVVYHNNSTNTIIDNGGQGVFPPGIVWTGPGIEGTPENYCVIRFTAPASGLYRLETTARSVLDGSSASDADFHVLQSGVEIFGTNVPPREATAYTNTLDLSFGDTVDLVTGRGADNRFDGSGLKIKANLTLVEERLTPPRIVQEPGSAEVIAGTDVHFTVGAVGSAPLQYQWLFNASNELANAQSATLTLSNVQSAQAGGYSVRVSNTAGSATSAVAVLTVHAASTHDLERDYTGSNPAGVWSYGWQGTLGGSFGLLSYHGTRSDGLDYWMLSASQVPVVYHNNSTNTIIDNAGQGVFPPGIIWTGPGIEGTPQNYSVIRFSTPRSGVYQLQTAARSVLDGNLASDADFHVLHNGVAMFGSNVPPREATGFTNIVELGAGDTVDFVTGRGADNRFDGSGLKIKAYLTIIEETESPPSILQDPANATVPTGSDVKFNVQVSGTAPLDYQWFYNGSELSGANGTSLTLSNVQPEQSGGYFVRVSNALGVVTSRVAMLTVYGVSTHDVERDYTGANPAGVWAYGWKGTLNGPFALLGAHGTRADGLNYWLLSTSHTPAVYHNSSSNTIVDNDGQGVFPPSSFWTGPGNDGRPENYCVVRFTAPVAGLYQLATVARSVLDGNLASDADFHVLLSGTELFGENVPPRGEISYGNTMEVAAGETIDFITGRGAGNRFAGSGLKLKAYLTLLEERPTAPRILEGPADAIVYEGGDVSFTVNAVGNAPLAYQWLYNGNELSGAQDATLTLSNVQTSDAGGYSVRVSNPSGSITSSVATLTVRSTGTHDVERDYTGTNPSGVWSYGWKGTLTGLFSLLGFHGTRADGLDYWLLSPSHTPAVYRNNSSNTIVDNAGQGVFASGSFWTGPGNDGRPENYCVVRFTAPVSGLYRLEAFVRSVLDGSLATDADFHVLHNDVELFGYNVPPMGETNYSTTVEVAAGDTIDFITGRGADNLFAGSGLKLKAYLTLEEEHITAPRILQEPTDAIAFVGQDVTFSVRAAGTAPLAYQWLYNGSELSEAQAATLTLRTVQLSQAGEYSVRVSNGAGSITSSVAHLTVREGSTHDLDRDYTGGNPSGVWRFGWKQTVNGEFGLLGFYGTRSDGLDFWLLNASRTPAVYHNSSSNVIVDNAGQGVFAPGSTWTGPGHEGMPENYCVIRFTAPASGSYSLETIARSVLDGDLASDADFHVLHNEVELFGQNVPARGETAYTTTMDLAAGDTIDLVTGRGADNSFNGSGLKIKAYLTLEEEHMTAPRILQGPADAAVFVGQDVSFTVRAAGTAPLVYQWLYNGSELAGAHSATLRLRTVQLSQAGEYSVRVSNTSGSAMSSVAHLTVQQGSTHDLERDYASANPSGAWAFGWKGTLNGSFALLAHHGSRADGLDYWLLNSFRTPAVYYNSSSNTIIDNAGQGVFAPGSFWTGPGNDGMPENYCVVRFTASAGGLYRLETFARSVLDGDLATDADFHVLHNNVELFGQNVPARGETAYSNTVEVAAGDTIDFVTGRGADNLFVGSGLKIKAHLTIVQANQSLVAAIALTPQVVFRESDVKKYVLSANGSNAPAILNGRGSTDPNGAPLAFAWFTAEASEPFSTNDFTLRSAALGEHTVTLVVDNGQSSDSGQITFEVITVVAALHELGRAIGQSELPDGTARPLQAALELVSESLGQGDIEQAITELLAFQWKVQTQVHSGYPALAERFMNVSDEIIYLLILDVN